MDIIQCFEKGEKIVEISQTYEMNNSMIATIVKL